MVGFFEVAEKGCDIFNQFLQRGTWLLILVVASLLSSERPCKQVAMSRYRLLLKLQLLSWGWKRTSVRLSRQTFSSGGGKWAWIPRKFWKFELSETLFLAFWVTFMLLVHWLYIYKPGLTITSKCTTVWCCCRFLVLIRFLLHFLSMIMWLCTHVASIWGLVKCGLYPWGRLLRGSKELPPAMWASVNTCNKCVYKKYSPFPGASFMNLTCSHYVRSVTRRCL